jgi:hypothetical protein
MQLIFLYETLGHIFKRYVLNTTSIARRTNIYILNGCYHMMVKLILWVLHCNEYIVPVLNLWITLSFLKQIFKKTEIICYKTHNSQFIMSYDKRHFGHILMYCRFYKTKKRSNMVKVMSAQEFQRHYTESPI